MAFKSAIMEKWAPKPKSGAVRPLVVAEAPTFECRHTPDEVWECAPGSVKVCKLTAAASPSVAKNEADDGQCSLDEVATLNVRELLFPGDKTWPVINKYIYILRAGDGTPVAEIFSGPNESTEAEEPADLDSLPVEWHICRDPSPSAQPSARTLQGPYPDVIDLKADVYRVYISPFRLSARAFERLVACHTSSGVQRDLETNALATVAVPCPFAWGEATHSDFFAPKLLDYRRFTTGREIQSANTVHNALQAWIAHEGDTLDIADDLDQTEFSRFRTDFDTYEKHLREELDKAAAYLAGWLDSDPHRIAEMAAQDNAGTDMCQTAGHWAYVSRDLVQAEPTRRFAEALLQDKERFPCTHVFFGALGLPDPWGFEYPDQPTTDVPSDHWFKWTKRSLSAIVGTLNNLVPAMAGWNSLIKDHKTYVEMYEASLEHLKIIKNIKVKDFLNTLRTQPHGATLQRYYYADGIWTGGFKVHKESRVASASDLFKSKADALDEQLDAVARPWMRSTSWLRNLAMPLDLVLSLGIAYIEITSLARSLSMNQEISLSKAAGVVKSVADSARAITVVATFVQQTWVDAAKANLATAKALKPVITPGSRADINLVAEAVATRENQLLRLSSTLVVLQKAAAALAIVSGICEAASRSQKAYVEIGREDWGAFVGHGVALIGAALTIAGGVITWCTIGGSTVGPFGAAAGAIIGLIGGILVLIGAAIASFWRKSEYEDFARGSCFGNQDDEFTVHWCDQPLFRERAPSVHLRNLQLLMANFWVSVEGDGKISTSKIIIEPGPLARGDTYTVRLEATVTPFDRSVQPLPTSYSTRSVVCVLQIDPFNRTAPDQWAAYAHHASGKDNFRPDTVRITRDQHEAPTRIEVALAPRQFVLKVQSGYEHLKTDRASYQGGNAAAVAYVRLNHATGSGLPGLPVKANASIKFVTDDLDGEKVSSMNSSYHYFAE